MAERAHASIYDGNRRLCSMFTIKSTSRRCAYISTVNTAYYSTLPIGCLLTNAPRVVYTVPGITYNRKSSTLLPTDGRYYSKDVGRNGVSK